MSRGVQGVTLPGVDISGVGYLGGVSIQGVSTHPTPPQTWDTTGYGRQVGGMHLNVMPSCSYKHFEVGSVTSLVQTFLVPGSLATSQICSQAD